MSSSDKRRGRKGGSQPETSTASSAAAPVASADSASPSNATRSILHEVQAMFTAAAGSNSSPVASSSSSESSVVATSSDTSNRQHRPQHQRNAKQSTQHTQNAGRKNSKSRTDSKSSDEVKMETSAASTAQPLSSASTNSSSFKVDSDPVSALFASVAAYQAQNSKSSSPVVSPSSASGSSVSSTVSKSSDSTANNSKSRPRPIPTQSGHPSSTSSGSKSSSTKHSERNSKHHHARPASPSASPAPSSDSASPSSAEVRSLSPPSAQHVVQGSGAQDSVSSTCSSTISQPLPALSVSPAQPQPPHSQPAQPAPLPSDPLADPLFAQLLQQLQLQPDFGPGAPGAPNSSLSSLPAKPPSPAASAPSMSDSLAQSLLSGRQPSLTNSIEMLAASLFGPPAPPQPSSRPAQQQLAPPAAAAPPLAGKDGMFSPLARGPSPSGPMPPSYQHHPMGSPLPSGVPSGLSHGLPPGLGPSGLFGPPKPGGPPMQGLPPPLPPHAHQGPSMHAPPPGWPAHYPPPSRLPGHPSQHSPFPGGPMGGGSLGGGPNGPFPPHSSHLHPHAHAHGAHPAGPFSGRPHDAPMGRMPPSAPFPGGAGPFGPLGGGSSGSSSAPLGGPFGGPGGPMTGMFPPPAGPHRPSPLDHLAAGHPEHRPDRAPPTSSQSNAAMMQSLSQLLSAPSASTPAPAPAPPAPAPVPAAAAVPLSLPPGPLGLSDLSLLASLPPDMLNQLVSALQSIGGNAPPLSAAPAPSSSSVLPSTAAPASPTAPAPTIAPASAPLVESTSFVNAPAKPVTATSSASENYQSTSKHQFSEGQSVGASASSASSASTIRRPIPASPSGPRPLPASAAAAKPSSSSNSSGSSSSHGARNDKESQQNKEKVNYSKAKDGAKSGSGGKKDYSRSFARPACVRDLQSLFESGGAFFQSLQPDADSARVRDELAARLQAKLRRRFPGCELLVYGSSVTGMSLKCSDIDTCLKLAPSAQRSEAEAEAVSVMAELLDPECDPDVEADSLLALPQARVPIIKFVDRPSGLAVDICVNNELAPLNSALIRDYGRLDARVRLLVLAVKHFAKNRLINDPYRGSLSSYAYVLLVIYFLQTRRPPVLPVLQQGVHQPVLVGGFDVWYQSGQIDKLKSVGATNADSLAQLLADFFRFYAHEFVYHDHVVSVRLGRPAAKEDKDWTREAAKEARDRLDQQEAAAEDDDADGDEADQSNDDDDDEEEDAKADEKARAHRRKRRQLGNFWFCIEDPFEVTHNLGRMVSRQSLHTIRGEFMRAWRLMVDGFEPVANIFQSKPPPADKKK